MEKFVLMEKSDDLAIVTLNRPEKRNALNPVLLSQLSDLFRRIKEDQTIRAIVLTGNGSAFCAGADLAYLKEISQYTKKENEKDSRTLAKLLQQIYKMPKLTIAMVNGPALAGGCGLALACDFVFADQDNAQFGFSEVRIGFIPAIVMNFLIRRVAPATAYHLAISGQLLSAGEALEKGIVDAVFLTEELKKNTLSFIDHVLRQNSFQAMIQTKILFQKLIELPLKEGLKYSSRINAQSRQSADCQKGLSGFLNKTKINWRTM